MFASHAAALAERLAGLRAKEQSRREAFARGVERYVPAAALAALGLGAPPPRCSVSVPPPSGESSSPLDDDRHVTLDDVRAVPLTLPSASEPGDAEAAAALADPLSWSSPSAAVAPPAPTATTTGQEEPPELQNARLRAEVAALRAAEAALFASSASTAPAPRSVGVGSESSVPPSPRATVPPDAAPSSSPSSADRAAANYAAALAARDELVSVLQRRADEERRRAEGYAERIRDLEAAAARRAAVTSTSALAAERAPAAAASNAAVDDGNGASPVTPSVVALDESEP